ncbi:uncharacterized protein ACA1_265990 [Acanthamoeba castellanii str. Neff]|uniref:ABM domain-containing protein n=1 Tax=Acanthamoeba castellanii (strain ATCC 30010 / Neff) TaxID=1257118 RepID=L8H1I4_ACACF|nr:uncharacterized protein ACA1_265990 [Acanthamoeba castellanii str. Neff]ELR19374.1 hypothetical protein ACA1_265990 [Acanthamoeba castellanii str. Neff]
MEHKFYPPTTVVELLEFEVPPGEVDQFIEADERVWTAYLSSCPGFLDKQEESSGALLDERQVVCATVWWASLELWKAIPQSELDKVQEQFVRELEGKEFPITKADAFQLRKAGGCSKTLSSTK